MSPRIGDGNTNSPMYWDTVYRTRFYPTLAADNLQRYKAAAALQRGDSALDVGCGQAALGVMLLADHLDLTYLGIDYSAEALYSHYLAKGDEDRWALFYRDWRQLPTLMAAGYLWQYQDRHIGPTFATVYLDEILEHEPEPAEMLAAIAPLAEQRIVLTVPRYHELRYDEHRGEHAWDFTEAELRELLEHYGKVGALVPASARCWALWVDR